MYSREQLIEYKYFEEVLDGHRLSDVLDGLTGLVSKAHMLAFAQSLIKAETPFTFGMVDLDNFKYINDTYGHAMGDKMLAAVAEKLQEFFSGYGIVGRFGGDEFLFIDFRNLTYDEKKLSCQNLFGYGYPDKNALRRSFDLGEYELFMTGTVGLASYPSDAKTYNELFSLIDKTLYRGKSKGRNCYIIYLEAKHKDIEIVRLKKNTLYNTFKNLAAGFDSSDDFYEKLKAGYESLKNDLHITNMFFAGKEKELKSIVDGHILGIAEDIDLLMNDEAYATNEISQIQKTSPQLYKILAENEIEAVLIMKVNVGTENFGFLLCAEPHTLRIWQENEYAIMFLFARMLAEYMQGKQISV